MREAELPNQLHLLLHIHPVGKIDCRLRQTKSAVVFSCSLYDSTESPDAAAEYFSAFGCPAAIC